jgi:hypothetical protein
MRFDGAVLQVSTGAVERQWKLTPHGLATMTVKDLATGRVYGGQPATDCDWSLPDLTGERAAAKLTDLTAAASDDQGFTSEHLQVVSQWEYPAAGLAVQHVVWAYPGAAGLRTELRLKRLGPSQNRFPRDAGVTETLPVAVGGLQLRAVGYYSQTQRRNSPATELLREDLAPSAPAGGSNDWANLLDLRGRGGGLILVKESHKCINTPQGGANTGGFAWDAGTLRSTGLGWYLDDVDGARFHRCWANWVVLFTAATTRWPWP